MTRDAPHLYRAERPKAFIDAVVAIAMTLLILPLMDSVADLDDASVSTADWFVDHRWQLTSFVLSFVLIAMFWLNHQRLFSGVEHVTTGLLWICMAWLLSIVWLPVATALSGRADGEDPLVKGIYIGSLIATAAIGLIHRLYLREHSELHNLTPDVLRSGLAADIAMCVLFSIALVVAVLVPVVGYLALLVMFLMGPAQSLLLRILPPR